MLLATCWPYSVPSLSIWSAVSWAKQSSPILHFSLYTLSATNPICIAFSTYRSNFPARPFNICVPRVWISCFCCFGKDSGNMLQRTYGPSLPFCDETESEIPLQISTDWEQNKSLLLRLLRQLLASVRLSRGPMSLIGRRYVQEQAPQDWWWDVQGMGHVAVGNREVSNGDGSTWEYNKRSIYNT